MVRSTHDLCTCLLHSSYTINWLHWWWYNADFSFHWLGMRTHATGWLRCRCALYVFSGNVFVFFMCYLELSCCCVFHITCAGCSLVRVTDYLMKIFFCFKTGLMQNLLWYIVDASKAVSLDSLPMRVKARPPLWKPARVALLLHFKLWCQ